MVKANPEVKPHDGVIGTVLTMALAQLSQAPALINGLVAQALATLPGLLTLTPAQRKTSSGKLKSGQLKAIISVFNATKKFPQYFTSLANKDFGKDPNVFESELLLDRAGRLPLLVAIRQAFTPLIDRLDDTILEIAHQVAVPAKDAYHIARPLADTNADLRTELQDAIEFYGAIGRKGAKTKADKKKAK